MNSQGVMARSSAQAHPNPNPRVWVNVKRQVLSFLRNRGRPALIGEISLWIGMSLKQSTEIADALLEKGLIRKLEAKEIRDAGLQEAHLGYAFVLCDSSRIPMGDADSIPIDIL